GVVADQLRAEPGEAVWRVTDDEPALTPVRMVLAPRHEFIKPPRFRPTAARIRPQRGRGMATRGGELSTPLLLIRQRGPVTFGLLAGRDAGIDEAPSGGRNVPATHEAEGGVH